MNQDIFDVSRFGTDLKDVMKAEREDFPVLDEWLSARDRSSTVLLDLSRVEFIGYSYAKQTVRRALQKLMDRSYPVSSIVLRYDGEDYKTRLDGLGYALNERRMTCLLQLPRTDDATLIGYLGFQDHAFESTKDRKKREKMQAVMNNLVQKKALYTNEVAKSLNLKLPYCNRLLDELSGMRLLHRVKETSPTGGPIYLNRLANL